MGFSHHHRFFSKIDGRYAISFLYGLDYSINKASKRIDAVNNIIDESVNHVSYVNDFNEEYTDERNWFEKYTDDYYKTNLTTGATGDALAHENNVFATLDKLGSYILWAEDNKQSEREEKYVYKYYDDEAKFMRKVHGREMSYDGMVKPGNENTQADVIHYLTQMGRNYKKSKDIVVAPVDLSRDDYCGDVLRDYSDLIEIIRREAKNTEDYRYKRSVQALMPEIRADMTLSKVQLAGIFDSSANKLLADSTEINWDAIDYYDKDTLKALIQYCRVGSTQDFQEDRQCIMYDFTSLVDKAKKSGRISPANIQVLKHYENGMTTEQIGNILGKSRQAVRININTICNAIIKQYEDDVEDWLYTYYRKGQYKTCNKCGETKLSSKFSKQLSNKDGLKTYCKSCENKQRQLRKVNVSV